MTRVKTMIRTMKKSSVSLVTITASGLNAPVIALLMMDWSKVSASQDGNLIRDCPVRKRSIHRFTSVNVSGLTK